MNKLLKAFMCAGLCGTMVLAAACTSNNGGTDEQVADPESRALALSISKPDGNFNPFYYTSAPDGQVINMTQASLLTAEYDENEGAVYAVGENYPTVAKDIKITYYDSQTGGSECSSNVAAENGRTEYEFLIKNGMKFSTGEDLTIRDVLFNFYVYLDTAYTGSNTMYSVDIQGLLAYQENNSTYGLDNTGGNTSQYVSAAQGRLRNLILWAKGEISETEQLKSDAKVVRELFEEELTTDWNSLESSWKETYEINYSFTEAWQAYLFQEGLVTAQKLTRADGSSYDVRVDKNGNPIDPQSSEEAKAAYDTAITLTTLDPYVEGAGTPVGGIFREREINEIAEATSSAKITEYKDANPGTTDEIAKLELSKKYCIDRMFSEYFANDEDISGLDAVLSYWATGNSAYTYFLADARKAALEDKSNPMNYIKGIQTYSTRTFNNVNLGEDYDVLKIIINKVDPAAIWQFGISIAPISYYSGTYKGVDYIEKATGYQVKNGAEVTAEDSFGVKRGDVDFFNSVVKGQNTDKSAIPVGAGPYRASTMGGGKAGSASQFYDNAGIIYYERNENFATMGSGLNNAKIKYLRYKYVDDDRIIPSVAGGQIDYGEPSGSTTNQTAVNNYVNSGTIAKYSYQTNGFGYVGVNPTYVPDVNIRRIIMSVMSVTLASDYYGELSSPLYRPMSRTSWAYPKVGVEYNGDVYSDTSYYPAYANVDAIKAELNKYGYTVQGNGALKHKDTGHELKYTFTIAGGNSDHPAYNMFQEAARLLNSAGFSISISTDTQALVKLSKGQLTVWAAAWSSGVDPDMYQLYHKDSNATSVLNWGYKTILNDTTGTYDNEKIWIDRLSEWIEDGRKYLDKAERTEIYAKCLDLIMEMAVELPIYQRSDLCIVNKTLIDVNTLNQQPNSTVGVIDRIWEVNYLFK